eukprot:1113575-Amphidinium_carterae.1
MPHPGSRILDKLGSQHERGRELSASNPLGFRVRSSQASSRQQLPAASEIIAEEAAKESTRNCSHTTKKTKYTEADRPT